MNDLEYMSLAIEEAKKAFEADEVPVGAIIVKDNKVIATGYNKRETENNALYHAEIVAIEQACKALGSWRLDGCTIYVTLEPCLMCTGAIIQSRIERVVFGALDEKGGSVVSVVQGFDIQGWNHYPIYTSRVYEEECSQLLKDFFVKKREKR